MVYKCLELLLDKRPGEGTDEGVAEADVPGLGPVEIGVARTGAEDAEGVEGVVRGPFELEREEAALPYQTLGMCRPDRLQFTLKVALRHREGRLQLNTGRGNRILHTRKLWFHTALFPCHQLLQ